MRYSVFVFICSLFFTILSSCEESINPDDLLISRENIQGKWLLNSERIVTFFPNGNVNDTTLLYGDIELHINTTGICGIYYRIPDVLEEYKFYFIEPDTISFVSCPVNLVCDPIIYLITYKIIDFNRTKNMTLKRIDDHIRYFDDEYEHIKTDTITRYYTKL